MRRFRYLPLGLRVICALLATAPLAVLALAVQQRVALAELQPWRLLLLATCYCGMPWTLVTLLLGRRTAFLHALIAECAGLLAIACVHTPALPAALLYVHHAFAMVMVVLALMLVNRDRLFPFLFPGPRGFRRAARVAVNQRVQVEAPRLGLTVDAMVEDVSETGLALYAGETALDELLVALARGEPLVVRARVHRERHEVAVSYLWQTRLSDVARLGVRARDPRTMTALFKALAPEAARGTAARRLLSYALAAALLAAMILPRLVRG